MTTREEWLALAEKCRRIKGPHPRLDAQIALASGEQILRVYNDGGWSMAHRGDVHWWTHCPASAAKKDVARHAQDAIMGSIKRVNYGQSLDAITGLIAHALPGWAWRVASCHVSDDAWLVPDYGDPAHGDRLRAELGEPRKDHWTDDGIDIDRRPPGNPALALCEAFCRAMAESGARGRD